MPPASARQHRPKPPSEGTHRFATYVIGAAIFALVLETAILKGASAEMIVALAGPLGMWAGALGAALKFGNDHDRPIRLARLQLEPARELPPAASEPPPSTPSSGG